MFVPDIFISCKNNIQEYYVIISLLVGFALIFDDVFLVNK